MVFILKNQDFNVNEESVTKQLETMHFLHHSISHLLHLFIPKLLNLDCREEIYFHCS